MFARDNSADMSHDVCVRAQETYEIMTPESVGLSSNMLVLGKHSGKHAYRWRLIELGCVR